MPRTYLASDFNLELVADIVAKQGLITEDQKRAVEAMSQAIVNKMLHAPLVVLKQAAASTEAGDNTIAVARRLFNLDRELKRPGHERTAEAPVQEDAHHDQGKKSSCR